MRFINNKLIFNAIDGVNTKIRKRNHSIKFFLGIFFTVSKSIIIIIVTVFLISISGVVVPNNKILQLVNDSIIYNKINELNIDSFKQRVVNVKNVKRNIKEAEKSLRKNKCPRCGGKLKKKSRKYGKIKRCKNYPECTFKINI